MYQGLSFYVLLFVLAFVYVFIMGLNQLMTAMNVCVRVNMFLVVSKYAKQRCRSIILSALMFIFYVYFFRPQLIMLFRQCRIFRIAKKGHDAYYRVFALLLINVISRI